MGVKIDSSDFTIEKMLKIEERATQLTLLDKVEKDYLNGMSIAEIFKIIDDSDPKDSKAGILSNIEMKLLTIVGVMNTQKFYKKDNYEEEIKMAEDIIANLKMLMEFKHE